MVIQKSKSFGPFDFNIPSQGSVLPLVLKVLALMDAVLDFVNKVEKATDERRKNIFVTSNKVKEM